MSEPSRQRHVPVDELLVDMPWTPEQAFELADAIAAKLVADAERAPRRPTFLLELTSDEAKFLGKAMVVQIALAQMRAAA